MKIKRLLSVFLLCVCLSGLLAIPAQAADAPDIRVTNFVRRYTLASGGPYCDCGYQKKRT